MNEVEAVKDQSVLVSIPVLLKKHYSEQMSDIWEFGLNVGLRISDTLGIKFTDFVNGRLEIIEGKTKKKASIHLNEKALAIMESVLQQHPNDVYFFQSRSTRNLSGRIKPLSRQAVSQAFKSVGEMVGVDLGTHSMRKTRGYHLYKKTNDIARVSKMLRHSSTGVTLRYIGITQESIDQDFEDLVL